MRLLRKFGRDARGATAIEYGLILALVFLAMLVALQNLGQSVIGMWTIVATKVTSTTVN